MVALTRAAAATGPETNEVECGKVRLLLTKLGIEQALRASCYAQVEELPRVAAAKRNQRKPKSSQYGKIGVFSYHLNMVWIGRLNVPCT